MSFGFSGTKRTVVIERCPYYRGVRKERLDCTLSYMWTFLDYYVFYTTT